MAASFVINKTKGTIPFYFRLTDTSDLSLFTSASDYQRIWSITNIRTSSIEYFESTSASVNYCISADSLLGDTYTVSLSALVSAGSFVTSSAFLSGAGPEEPVRFTDSKVLDLSAYLPSYLKETETNELMIFFQDFWNTLYDKKVYTQSATEYEVGNRQKISILEKINRLADLQDPSLCDIEYLQFFANNLGYNIDVFRSELGVLTDVNSEDPEVQEDVKRYLRFIVSNLPNWYRIKTTNNAVKIMLYSFGLVGDLITRYTKNYQEDDGSNWINFREGRDNFNNLSKDFYPTPHYVISIELDSSSENFSLNGETRRNVINAVESIRPANTVNDGYLGHIERDMTVYVRAYCRKRAYFRFNL